MLGPIVFCQILVYWTPATAVSVKIDGLIDLGPKWNFEYNLVPMSDQNVQQSSRQESQTNSILDSLSKKTHTNKNGIKLNLGLLSSNSSFTISGLTFPKPSTTMTIGITNTTKDPNRATRFYIFNKKTDNNTIFLGVPRSVREDSRVKDFTAHIFKQTLTLFDNLKSKVNDTKLQRKIDFLTRSYKEKFAEFVNETQYQKIRTRLGTQRVILNTMDTSNRLLKRLVNYLLSDMNDKHILRQAKLGAAAVLEQELDKEIDVEYKHICRKFGICRAGYGFSDFLVDVITEILRTDNVKLKRAVDAFTEVLKNVDLGKLIDSKLKSKFVGGIEFVETWGATYLRPLLTTIRNLLASKNMPLAVMPGMDQALLNKTIALLDLVDTLDEKIPANEVNKLEWNDNRFSMKEWADGSRGDVLEIMEAVVRHIVMRGIKLFDPQTASNVRKKIKIILD